jgi:hypothetical protein
VLMGPLRPSSGLCTRLALPFRSLHPACPRAPAFEGHLPSVTRHPCGARDIRVRVR